jgi:hypothetical protein
MSKYAQFLRLRSMVVALLDGPRQVTEWCWIRGFFVAGEEVCALEVSFDAVYTQTFTVKVNVFSSAACEMQKAESVGLEVLKAVLMGRALEQFLKSFHIPADEVAGFFADAQAAQ